MRGLATIALVLLLAPAVFAKESSSWLTFSPAASNEIVAKSLADRPGCSAAIWKGCLIRVGGANSPRIDLIPLNNDPSRRLADLPMRSASTQAAVMADTLYILADCNLYSLDLAAKDAKWMSLSAVPFSPSQTIAITAQDGQINIFTPTSAWAYRPAPRDGTESAGWISLEPVPAHMAPTIAIPTGQTHIFLLDPRAKRIFAYDTVTDMYADAGIWQNPLAAEIPLVIDSKILLFSADSSNPIEVQLRPTARRLSWLDYSTIAVYFALFAAVGAYFARRQTSTETFALGNRNVKWWLAGISLYATGTSAISYMAIPALTYSSNLLWWILPVPLAALALIPQAYVIIPLIRRLNLTSTYEYLERRFNRSLRLLASAQCIVFQVVGRMAVVILLPSLAISAATGISLLAAVLIMGAVTTVYTAIGGIEAVIWTDAIQTILTIGGPLLALAIILFSFGSHPGEIFSIDEKYSKFNLFLFDWNFALPVFWIFIITTIFSVVGFAGDQTMVQRVLATPSDKAARRATLTLFAFVAIGSTIFHVLGVALFAYFHAHPADLDPKMSNDQVVPLFIVQKMPVGIAGLLVAGIFGASMSAVSGTINSVATLVVEDFYRRLRPAASDRQRLRLMKATSYTVGILSTGVAAYMAMANLRSIFETWMTLIALLGGGIGGVFTLGMLTRRANSAGVLIGAVFSVFFALYIKQYTHLHWTLYAPAAIGSCVIVGYATSFLFPPATNDLEGLTIFTMRRKEVPEYQPDLVPT